MPPKLARVSAEDTLRALRRLGFVKVRQRGSHIVLRKEIPGGTVCCVVPQRRDLIPIGTLHSILRQARVTPEEFMENL
jgi:predicted RNA binding protein YcfA (HicA-like mRNA interferase family)